MLASSLFRAAYKACISSIQLQWPKKRRCVSESSPTQRVTFTTAAYSDRAAAGSFRYRSFVKSSYQVSEHQYKIIWMKSFAVILARTFSAVCQMSQGPRSEVGSVESKIVQWPEWIQTPTRQAVGWRYRMWKMGTTRDGRLHLAVQDAVGSQG